MNYDQKFWLLFFVIVGCTLVSLAACFAVGYVKSWQYLTENGYEQQSVAGQHFTVWVKVKDKGEEQ